MITCELYTGNPSCCKKLPIHYPVPEMPNLSQFSVTSTLLALICSANCWGQTVSSDDANAGEPGKNCVLIMVDGLRADALNAAPGEESFAPNISQFSSTAVHFTHARTPSSMNVQSVASPFSGRLPTLGGTIGVYEAEPHDGQPNLARAFKKADYYTGMVSNQGAIGSYEFTRHFDDIQLATPAKPRFAMDLVLQARSFLADAGEDRHFLFVHFGLPLPVNPDTEAYQRAVQDVDTAVGALLDTLVSMPEKSRPLIALTAPNGFELGEHGAFGNGWTLNEEVLRVPLILHDPARFESGKIEYPVSTLQLTSTLAMLCGLEDSFPESEPLFDDESLGFVPSTEPLISELIIPERVILRSITDGAWKYTAGTRFTTPANRAVLARAHAATALAYRDGSEEPPPLWGSSAHESLVHLGDDPQERRNLIYDSTEQAMHLRDALAEYEQHCRENAIPPRLSTQQLELLPEENREELEALGYL